MQVVVRTEGDPGASTAAVRTILRGIADTLLVYDASTMGGRIEESLATRRLTMRLLAVFAGVALLLAAVGIYGAVSHAVSLRTREIGIRAALGAARRDLMTLVIGYGMRLTLTGVIVGLAASVAATRLMTTLLYAIDPADGPTLVGVSVLLVVVSAMACYLPARRATRVDPVTALRAE
jgi:ABC-type antimicrobial peptide transport system permease subunit